MKRIQWFSSVAVVCAVAFGAVGAGDVFSQLGVQKSHVNDSIARSFLDGYVPVSEVRAQLKAASPAARAAIVEQVLVATKAFTATPQFAKVYTEMRNERKPEAPQAASAAALIAQQKKDAQANVADVKKLVAQAPKADREGLEIMLEEAQRQLAMFDSAEYREMMEQQFAADQESYKEQLAQWNADLPADPKAAVRKRLREFLETSKNVDYGAKLNGRRFANAAYEDQSSEWKLCYRAGKEPVEKARAFATQWLAELK